MPLACAVATALGGCSAGEPSERDLGAPLAPVETCVPSPKGKPVYFGNNSIESRSPVTITGVELVGKQGDVQMEPFVVPVAAWVRGPLASFNPAREPDWSWDQARPAAGSVVDAENSPMDVVVELSTTSRGGGEAVRINYELDGSSFYAILHNSMELVAGRRC